MKRIISVSFLVYCLIFISACTSTNISETGSTVVTDRREYCYKNPNDNIKYVINNWMYKGFGKKLPAWVIPALENNKKSIKKVFPQLKDCEIVILEGVGYNLD